MARDPYAVLGVPRDADAKAIKRAYRKLAQQYHPDRNPDDADAEQRFKEVNAAHEVLGDPEKRAMYDEFGEDAAKMGFDPDKARAYRQWRGQGGGAAGGIDIEELLSSMFGGGGGGAGFGGFGGPPRPRKGADLRAELTLDFTTACKGGERTLQLQGAGPVTVRIPAGVSDGGTLRLRGKGRPGPAGGPAGDLLLTVHVASDPHFERDGDHLRLEVPVTLSEALRGTQVEVPTLDGAVKLRVPPGAQSGQVLRVRGKGVARRGRPAGDLLVTLRVRLPELPDLDQLDAAQAQTLRDAIETLDALQDPDVRTDLTRRARSQASPADDAAA